jgi:hypothetical protein
LSIGAPEENRLKAGQHAKSAKKLKCARRTAKSIAGLNNREVRRSIAG